MPKRCLSHKQRKLLSWCDGYNDVIIYGSIPYVKANRRKAQKQPYMTTRLKNPIFRPLDKVLDSDFIIQQCTSEINLASALYGDGAEMSSLMRFIRREFINFCEATLPYSAEVWKDTRHGVLRNGESLNLWAISAPKRGAGSADPRKEFFKAINELIIEEGFNKLRDTYVAFTDDYVLCRRGMQLSSYPRYVLKDDLGLK